MQVGSLREQILIALLVHKFGEKNVKTDIPITESEVDVMLDGNPISVKTITQKGFSGVKLVWTVDQTIAQKFVAHYKPMCDLFLARIQWNSEGGLYYIPRETQNKILSQVGPEHYIRMPKAGTNPRGIEISADALRRLVFDNTTRTLTITWVRTEVNYNPLKRWIDLWKEDY